MAHGAVTHTSALQSDADLSAFYPLARARQHTQSHTCLHGVVLIKALDVSREICNSDI